MKRRILSCAVVTAFTLGILHAGEYRAPETTQNGPLRYDVYKKSGDKWALNMWSIGTMRSASRSFLKHGFKTNEFTALIFGADNFKVGQAFTPGTAASGKGDAAAFTENFNANLNSMNFAPRADYSEQGMIVGGRFEYPLCDNTARIGVKASVPFKTIRIERNDKAEKSAAGDLTNVVRGVSASVNVPVNDITTQAATSAIVKTAPVSVVSNMYRLSLVKDLPFLKDGAMTGFVSNNPTTNNMTIGGVEYGNSLPDASTSFDTDAGKAPFVLLGNANAGQIPFVESFAVQLDPALQQNFGSGAGAVNVQVPGATSPGNSIAGLLVQVGRVTGISAANIAVGTTAATGDKAPFQNISPAPTTGKLTENVLYAFSSPASASQGDKYQAVLDGPAAAIDNIWLLATNDKDGKMLSPSVVAALDGKIARYGTDSSEEWLNKNGYQFLTTQRMGLGDADIDLFYEHDFTVDWRGQAVLGLRLPTGGDNKYANNPYETRCLLGNGNHFEIKLGANLGWATPLDWLNVHADMNYSFALKGKEKRAAAFAGATIHGIGPQVDADVDWGYFVGRLDATMFHPKTDDLSTTWGYEFYLKTKDTVKFKQATIANDQDNGWFGQRWYNAGDKLQDGTEIATAPVSAQKAPGFYPWTQALDNKVAAQNTDRIAHRIRFESHWQAHKYMSLFIGGAFTFAGQNISRDADGHFGMNVRF